MGMIASSDIFRFYVYDAITLLIYGKSVGMVDSGHDVDHLISDWHQVFTLGGLIATLPWLISPIIKSRYMKRFLMPHKRHGSGSGHVMMVSLIFDMIVRLFSESWCFGYQLAGA